MVNTVKGALLYKAKMGLDGCLMALKYNKANCAKCDVHHSESPLVTFNDRKILTMGLVMF
jgi:hypothetical protein